VSVIFTVNDLFLDESDDEYWDIVMPILVKCDKETKFCCKQVKIMVNVE